MTTRKTWILFVLVILMVLPSCRSRKKVTPATTPATTTSTDAAPPDVPMTVPGSEDDFVTEPDTVGTEPSVTTEALSADPTEATRQAHDRGWIRDVFFDYDASSLSPDGQEALAVTASWLKSNPGYGLLIEGHCDERGTEQYNLALGDRRANIARDYLAGLGVEDGRMRTVSYGEERPFANGNGEQVWRQNRRAHLVLVRQ